MIDFKISSHNANRELNTLILSFSVLIISSKSSHDSALPSPLQGKKFDEIKSKLFECLFINILKTVWSFVRQKYS